MASFYTLYFYTLSGCEPLLLGLNENLEYCKGGPLDWKSGND